MSQPSVQQVIAQLVRGGQKPSLALLKARLGHSVPLPRLIQALQQWRQDPDLAATEPAEETETSATEPTLAEVLSEVRALRQEVAELRQALKKG